MVPTLAYKLVRLVRNLESVSLNLGSHLGITSGILGVVGAFLSKMTLGVGDDNLGD